MRLPWLEVRSGNGKGEMLLSAAVMGRDEAAANGDRRRLPPRLKRMSTLLGPASKAQMRASATIA